MLVSWILPPTSMKVRFAPLTMMSAMSSRASSGSKRAVAEHVVADVVEQILLLGDRHHDVLDRDDLVDDVADFVARRFRDRVATAATRSIASISAPKIMLFVT